MKKVIALILGLTAINASAQVHTYTAKQSSNTWSAQQYFMQSVGIGTAVPTYKLDIQTGDLGLDDNYTIRYGTGSTAIEATSNVAAKMRFFVKDVEVIRLNNAPVAGGAVCINSNRELSKCTSAIDGSGDCTCP